jgi:hypothetical protein
MAETFSESDSCKGKDLTAKASGLTPLAIRLTHALSVVRSRFVFCTKEESLVSLLIGPKCLDTRQGEQLRVDVRGDGIYPPVYQQPRARPGASVLDGN